MIHDAYGWWMAEAGLPEPLPPLTAGASADVVVVGGGFTGMWAAWALAEAGASVVLLEAGACGRGPSGRNGGFVSSLELSVPAATPLAVAARGAVVAIGEWCESEGVDAWYRTAPHWVVSTAPAQDDYARDAVDGDHVIALGPEALGPRCGSPVFRGAVEVRAGATVHPARLAFGLRARLLERGVRIFEGTAVRRLSDDGVATAGGVHVAAGAVVVAAGARGARFRGAHRRVTVGSSHIVMTEPVPDVIEALGWTGGEAISDGRALLHYFRTTRDGRILFGWAGGRMALGHRMGGRIEVDRAVVAQTARDLVRFFPALRDRRIDHAWGGPIDVSPNHMPEIRTLAGGRAWAAFGYTGNGVGPSRLVGTTLAALALGQSTDLPIVDPPARRVPPEPFRAAGAAVLRRALIRKEAIEERGETPSALLRELAGLPERIGMQIVR